MKKLLCACFVLAIGMCLAPTARGQSQITAGTVQGDVVDKTGASIAGAVIGAKNLDTSFTQTGTTQQQEIVAVTGFNSAGGNPPTYPGTVPVTPATLPLVGAGVTVFSKSYANPRINTTNVGYEQQLVGDYAAYLDFTMSKGVHLTRFTNPNVGGYRRQQSPRSTIRQLRGKPARI